MEKLVATETGATVERGNAITDLYAGLRMQGYSVIAAMRALRVVGLTLADAKAAAIAVGDLPEGFGGR